MANFGLKQISAGCLSLLICGGTTGGLFAQHQIADPYQNASEGTFKIGIGSTFNATSPNSSVKSRPEAAGLSPLTTDIAEALELIRTNHSGGESKKTDKLVSSAIDAMLHTLDPHSNFYTPDEFAELLGEHQNEYYGTGATIVNAVANGNRETFILATVANSPASIAGLRYGDRIIAVNGKDVSGESSVDVREMIRGKLGTSVELKLERADSNKVENVVVKRGRIEQKTVPHAFMLQDRLGYIDMTVGFSYETVGEVRRSIDDLKIKGLTSLVIDLRGNTGGLIDQAAAVAELFLEESLLIASQKGRSTMDDRVWRSRNKKPETMPLIVLVDSETASAAEIVAGALQDNDRALIVGERTFGKGLVQNVLDLADGSGLTLTAARYYTPSGRSIQRDYEKTGLYEYFSQTNRAEIIAETAQVARTLTNRRVYGGDGIGPDVIYTAKSLSARQLELTDLSLLFVKSFTAGSQERVSEARQDLIFGKDVVTDELVSAFEAFCKAPDVNNSAAVAPGEQVFVRSQLRYYLALAAFGNDIATRQKVNDDAIIAISKDLIADAARLKESANSVVTARRLKVKNSPKTISGELR